MMDTIKVIVKYLVRLAILWTGTTSVISGAQDERSPPTS